MLKSSAPLLITHGCCALKILFLLYNEIVVKVEHNHEKVCRYSWRGESLFYLKTIKLYPFSGLTKGHRYKPQVEFEHWRNGRAPPAILGPDSA